MKSIINSLMALFVAVLLTACGGGGSSSSTTTESTTSSTDTSTDNDPLSETQTSTSTSSKFVTITQSGYGTYFTIKWNRSGSSVEKYYGIYSQLEANTGASGYNQQKMIGQNMADTASVDCTRSVVGSDFITYICTPSNASSMSYNIKFNSNGVTTIKERGGVSATNPSMDLIELTPNSDGSLKVKYIN